MALLNLYVKHSFFHYSLKSAIEIKVFNAYKTGFYYSVFISSMWFFFCLTYFLANVQNGNQMARILSN